MQYKIIVTSCSYDSSYIKQYIKEFEQQVNEAIKEGWTPVGGISSFSDYYIMQALVK